MVLTNNSAPSRASRSCSVCELSSGKTGVRACARMSPVSRPASIFMMVTPVSVSPLRIADWTGDAPRYFGSSDVWTFTQPNFGKSRIAGGKICP